MGNILVMLDLYPNCIMRSREAADPGGAIPKHHGESLIRLTESFLS